MDAGANQKDRINFGNSILKTKTLIHTLILIPSHISFSLAKKIHYLYLREGFKKNIFYIWRGVTTGLPKTWCKCAQILSREDILRIVLKSQFSVMHYSNVS